MNTEEQDQDFTKLQQVLKLKRFEQPHPRYFNDFSGQVISRIRAGKTGSRFESVSDLVSRTPWLRRLWRKLEAKPALASVIATAACGLMMAGAFFMETGTPQNMNFLAGGASNGDQNNPAPSPALGMNLAATRAEQQFASSTNISPISTGPNLFQYMPNLQTMPAAGGVPQLPR